MSVNSIQILVGILEVRYILKITAKKNSYFGRGFLWFFLVVSGNCLYRTSNMRSNASTHTFLLSLPTALIFQGTIFRLPPFHTTAILCYTFRPLKKSFDVMILLNMNALNSKNYRKSLIFVPNNDGHTQCCYLIINSVSFSLHSWSLKYEMKEFFFSLYFRQLVILFATTSSSDVSECTVQTTL